jgi:hypothetical protein
MRSIYATELSTAKAFLQSNGDVKNGSRLTDEQQKSMLKFRIQCVHCGANLPKVDFNTEHILDLSMGGLNTLENKTLICKKCNLARSKLKQNLFGNTPQIAIWNFIEKYIIWSFITLDYGHSAGTWLPEIHMTFLKFANNGKEFEQSGIRYFARASDKRPTVLNQDSRVSPAAIKSRKPSPSKQRNSISLSGIRRWFRGSPHDHDNRPATQRSRTQRATQGEPEGQIASQSTSNNVPKESLAKTSLHPENTDDSRSRQPMELSIRAEDMRRCVGPHLPPPGEQELLTVISNAVKEQDPDGRAIKAIAIAGGFPSSWTVTRILEAAFGPSIEIHHSGGTTILTTKHTSSDTVKLLLSLIPEAGSIKQAELANLVKTQDPMGRSLRDFATLEKFPKSKPIHEFIALLLGDAAISSSEGSVYHWERAKGASTGEEVDRPNQQANTNLGGDYTREPAHSPITNFTSSSKGLRLPKSPRVLAQVLQAYNNTDLSSLGVFETIELLDQQFPALPRIKLNSFVFIIKAKFSPDKPIQTGQLRPVGGREYANLIRAKLELNQVALDDMAKVDSYLSEFIAAFAMMDGEEE